MKPKNRYKQTGCVIISTVSNTDEQSVQLYCRVGELRCFQVASVQAVVSMSTAPNSPLSLARLCELEEALQQSVCDRVDDETGRSARD